MGKGKGVRIVAAEQTRDALIQAGRQLFAAKGFHAAGTTEIVAAAGVSRGALQHHFPRKKDLFLAVIDAVERDWIDALRISGGEADAATWKGLIRRLDSFLDTASLPEIRRIVLLDGPAVLDWTEWRALRDRYSIVGVVLAVEEGIASGQISRQPVQPLVNLILALVYEAVLVVAHADQLEKTREEMKLALKSVLSGFTARPANLP